MVASRGPCDGSSTVSFSGQRVAAMRARRSSRSDSGTSIVNGRIAVPPFDCLAVTDMWLLTFGGYGADREVDTPIHRPSVGAGKNAPPRSEQNATFSVHPATPSGRRRPVGESAKSRY